LSILIFVKSLFSMVYWSYFEPKEVSAMPRRLSSSASFSLGAFLLASVLGLFGHPALAEVVPGALPEAPTPAVALDPAALDPGVGIPVLFYTRAYDPPTRHDDFHAYSMELIGPRTFIAASFRAGIEQTRLVPVGWGRDVPGYLQRYGSAYGEAAIDSTTRYSLAQVFHEDVRYFPCYGCSVWDKYENAVLAEVSARRGEDGHRVFSATPILAGFSGPLIAYAAWYPPGYSNAQAIQHAGLGFITRIGFHLLREFIVDRKP
jgi:hypothetical protein